MAYCTLAHTVIINQNNGNPCKDIWITLIQIRVKKNTFATSVMPHTFLNPPSIITNGGCITGIKGMFVIFAVSNTTIKPVTGNTCSPNITKAKPQVLFVKCVGILQYPKISCIDISKGNMKLKSGVISANIAHFKAIVFKSLKHTLMPSILSMERKNSFATIVQRVLFLKEH